MKNEEMRSWLDRYGEPIGHGCLYTEDRAIKFCDEKNTLFNENDFTNVVDYLKGAIEEVRENHLDFKWIEKYGKNKGQEIKNAISFLILHGAKATGGYGVWIVRDNAPELEQIFNSNNPWAIVGVANRGRL